VAAEAGDLRSPPGPARPSAPDRRLGSTVLGLLSSGLYLLIALRCVAHSPARNSPSACTDGSSPRREGKTACTIPLFGLSRMKGPLRLKHTADVPLILYSNTPR